MWRHSISLSEKLCRSGDSRIRRLRFLLTAVLQPAWKHWGLPAAAVMLLMAQPPRARSISLSNYDVGELTVAVTKQNNVDLNITGIEEITVNVGDGKATDTANNVPLDQLTGTVTPAGRPECCDQYCGYQQSGKAETGI